MNDFERHSSEEHSIMREIRGSGLFDFFVDVFQAADEKTRTDTSGFNALINEWLTEFEKACNHPVIRND